jgi:hypothetical protein
MAALAMFGAQIYGQSLADYGSDENDSGVFFGSKPIVQPDRPYTPGFELLSGDTHELYANISFDGEPSFDVQIILDVSSGDADLIITGPVALPDGSLLKDLAAVNVSYRCPLTNPYFVPRCTYESQLTSYADTLCSCFYLKTA